MRASRSTTSSRAASCRSSPAAPACISTRCCTACRRCPKPIRRCARRSRPRPASAAGPRCTPNSRASIPAPRARIHATDPQRIQRALEVYRAQRPPDQRMAARRTRRDRLPFRVLKLVLAPRDRAVLHARIERRFDAMLDAGFLDEVRALRALPDLQRHPHRWTCRRCARSAIARPGSTWTAQRDAAEFRDRAIAATRQLAKRQLTWLRGELDARWFDPATDATRWTRALAAVPRLTAADRADAASCAAGAGRAVYHRAVAAAGSARRAMRSGQPRSAPQQQQSGEHHVQGQSLQDPFLNALRRERVPVSIYLVNGIKLQGTIESLRPVRGAAAQHRQPDGLQARDLHRRAGAQRARGPGRRRRRRPADGSADDDRRGRGTSKHCRAARTTCDAEPCMFERSRKGEHALLIQPHRRRAAGRRRCWRNSPTWRAPPAPPSRHVLTARIDRPNPATLHRQRQARGSEGRRRRDRRRPGAGQPPLSPGQERNLEKALERRVVDRTGLILDIFAQRARSARRQAAGRAGAAASTWPRAWCAAGPTWSASAAVRSACAAPAKPSWKPTAACCRSASSSCRSGWRKSKCSARRCAARACAANCRASRWSATPTPASRRCSTR